MKITTPHAYKLRQLAGWYGTNSMDRFDIEIATEEYVRCKHS